MPYTDEYGRVVYDVEAEVKFDKSAVPPTQPATEPATEPATTPTSPNTPETNIPQTGTLLWLVPVLFATGAVLAAAGIIIRKKISK